MNRPIAGISRATEAAGRQKQQLGGKGAASRNSRWLKASLLPALIFALWELGSLSGRIDPLLFSAPHSIIAEFWSMTLSGELLLHLKVSMLRAFAGFLLGGTAGLLLGILAGMLRPVEDYIDPTIQMLRTIPMLALTPLFILWFGFGELSKILIISLGAFFPMYINSFQGVRNVDAKLFEVAEVLEFSRMKQITKLLIPAALPNILLGLRLSLSFAWMALVVAELMGAERGVGFLIQDARSFMQTAVVFIGVLIFAAAGKISDSLVRLLERRLLKWQDSYKGKRADGHLIRIFI
ncbi:ABC transporter permease [Paenibacillus typhae]|uniref:ABC transporter permease n=1 Tax=Paenibacillus typhae TaxID=1174501 RepID=UPI001C8E1EB5|nr:ABC transporter permease [Paenibacillus typhae]MBY0011692.1 ABC transporter permease [Paenibacillus typhae]